MQYVDALRSGDIELFKEIERQSGQWWHPALDRGGGACLHFAAENGQVNLHTSRQCYSEQPLMRRYIVTDKVLKLFLAFVSSQYPQGCDIRFSVSSLSAQICSPDPFLSVIQKSGPPTESSSTPLFC